MFTEALIMMITCYTFIIGVAGYFFYRVLTTKTKYPVDEDSNTENDPKDDQT